MKTRVLFVCVHNSARSQMSEAFLNALGGGEFEAESAGFEPTVINPVVVQVMSEAGYDLSQNTTQSVFELYKQGALFGVVVTVCDSAREKQCPIFPGVHTRLHWDLKNPEDYTGTEEEILDQVRELRDRIEGLVKGFIAENA